MQNQCVSLKTHNRLVKKFCYTATNDKYKLEIYVDPPPSYACVALTYSEFQFKIYFYVAMRKTCFSEIHAIFLSFLSSTNHQLNLTANIKTAVQIILSW